MRTAPRCLSDRRRGRQSRECASGRAAAHS